MPVPHEDTMYITCKYSDFLSLSQQYQDDIMDVACESSIDTIRHSIEGQGDDKILLKFNKWDWKYQGHPPSQLNHLSGYYDTFTRDEILVEMAKPEWTAEGEPPLE